MEEGYLLDQIEQVVSPDKFIHICFSIDVLLKWFQWIRVHLIQMIYHKLQPLPLVTWKVKFLSASLNTFYKQFIPTKCPCYFVNHIHKETVYMQEL